MGNILGTKGQLVIEKPIRDALGVEPGWVAVQRLIGDRVEIRFFPPQHDRSLQGILAPLVSRSLPPERWQEIRARAWGQRADEGTRAKA